MLVTPHKRFEDMSNISQSIAPGGTAGTSADSRNSKSSTRRYGGKTSEQRCNERRAALIAAAYNIAGEEGYYAATVRAICKRAGLSERYFYESFATREEILSEVYDEVILGARKAVLDATARVRAEDIAQVSVTTGSTHPLVEAAVRAFCEYLTEDPHRAAIAVIDSVSLSTNRDGMAITASTSFSELIAELGEAILGQPHPLLRVCAVGMVGYLSRTINYWSAHGGTIDRELIIGAATATCQGTINQLLHNGKLSDGGYYPAIADPAELAQSIGVDRKRGEA